LLHASNGFNSRSVAVEFVGNFPNERDRWWRPGRFGRHKLTPAQARGGRTLVTYLRRTLRITHIFAHRQSNRRHSNCCGPQVWYNVGQWAVGRGLNDGGSGYAISGGLPIPDAWRDASHDVFSR
jgi:hypothetical protein